MKTAFKVLILILVIIAVIAASIYVVMWDMKRSSYTSDYEYRVEINPDEDISNVTVLVPLPKELAGQNRSVPEGWEVEFVDNISVEGKKYENVLSIEADEIPSGTYQTLTISMESDEEIDTEDPWGKEPMLEPKSNTTEVECDYPGASEKVRCYSYSGGIFARFETEGEAQTHISVELYGTNSWWVGGWSGNEYFDRSITEIEGEATGHYETEGEVRTGVGNY